MLPIIRGFLLINNKSVNGNLSFLDYSDRPARQQQMVDFDPSTKSRKIVKRQTLSEIKSIVATLK